MLEAMPRARRKKSEPFEYGEKTNYYQFSLTLTASEMIDEIADELNITRSKVIEMAIRGGGLQAAKDFYNQSK
jgi:hypothetical protein